MARPEITETVVRTPGGKIACTTAGPDDAPALLLVHGLGATRRTWRKLIGALATDHRVIAADLPGHGDSEEPSGDYSLGAHATALRDVLTVLDVPAVTIVGHSLGGGIALQFAYQFPERTQRGVLISSGGLGPEVNLMLRAATLPGAETVVAQLARIPEGVTRRVLPLMSMLPRFLALEDAGPTAGTLHGLSDPRSRVAFVRTAQSVINWRGQTVSALKRLHLLAGMPVMIAWGANDQTIPPDHHRAFAQLVPTATVAEIPDAGHFLHETAADRLLPPLLDFLATEPPFEYSEERWRRLLTGDHSSVD
ncbi:alpha/beta fold hydrolase [Spongisporangium articulatum]|uniref:Alpha/beta fold hydrolase n=1 Tax=Spongisporangium articulatum TaxID=3362603 RepID=A0ABW8AJF2_9ACTN